MKGNIAETKGGHDRQGPVKTRDPGILLSFMLHDEMKKYAVAGNGYGNHGEELAQVPQVLSHGPVLEKVEHLGRQEFHLTLVFPSP